MNSIHEESDPSELLEPLQHIWNQSFNLVNFMSLKCAVELGIPDIIHEHGQPMALTDLISALPIHSTKSQYVSRLMATLVHSGFFQVHKNGANDDPNQRAYSLTPASGVLLKDSPFRGISTLSFNFDPVLIKPWFHLSTWFKNDDATAFRTAHGEELYQKFGNDPRLNLLMNESTAIDSLLISRVVVSKCKEVFEGLETLVDVGGGTGNFSRAVAEAFPDLECTVLDQPHVVAGLQGKENLKYVGGDMFEYIPPADAALLKMLMIDWNDENCIKILKRCKEAITSGGRKGKLIIIETVMGHMMRNKESTETQLFVDLELLVLFDGKQRNETEWAKLFFDAGFSNYKIHPVLGMRAVIEVFI